MNLSHIFLCNLLELTKRMTIYLKDFPLTLLSDGFVLFVPSQHEYEKKQKHLHGVK